MKNKSQFKAGEAREAYDTEDLFIIVALDHGGPSIQERMNFVVMNKEGD